MLITDSHNHLHLDSFFHDLGDVISRAQSFGVEQMLLVGIDPHDSQKALEVSSLKDGFYASIGIHPQEANEYSSSDVFNLSELALNPKVVAVGETGFDFYRSPESKDKQKEMFVAHIELASKLSLPLIIHDREAHDMTLSVLNKMDAWRLGGVFHCFSGDVQMASYILERGFVLSISGVVTYKNASLLKEVVRICPLHSLLVETDAPFLAPVPFRGKRNEPAFIIKTIEEIAKIKGRSFEDVAQIVSDNFNRLFLANKNCILRERGD